MTANEKKLVFEHEMVLMFQQTVYTQLHVQFKEC